MAEFAGLGDGARRFVGLPKLSGEFCAGAGFACPVTVRFEPHGPNWLVVFSFPWFGPGF